MLLDLWVKELVHDLFDRICVYELHWVHPKPASFAVVGFAFSVN